MALKIPAIGCTSTASASLYQTALKINDLVLYLLNGHDPRSQNWKNLPADVREMYEKLQRKTNKQRREAMTRYISRRMGPHSYWIGAVPPIVVGMRLDQPFVPNADADDDVQLGILRVKTQLDAPNILLDGLRRVTGYLDTMYDKDKTDDETRAWAAQAVLPIMLVAPLPGEELSLEQLGRLFHDMNTLSTPVAKGQAVDLDRSDLCIQTTNKVTKLPVITKNGGVDDSAVSIPKKGNVWATKTVLLKTVWASAEGPGSHVDHIRDEVTDAFLSGPKRQSELIERIEGALEEFVAHLPGGTVPMGETVVRTSPWWVAFGLVLHDLHQSYDGSFFNEEQRATMMRRMAKIDWSLGNPEFSFLGRSVESKSGTKSKDEHGRNIVNRFFGGSKAYYNLAALIRHKIGIRDHVGYGPDYGASIRFDERGAAIEAA